MSTYSYKVYFNDSEIIMLRSALLQLIEKCDNELLDGAKAPFFAHKHSAEAVLERLNKHVAQVSGNNFDDL